ncbi:shikimate dehydrogenase [Stappia albiluteola]|nr:shikimate dehydrogenase [Stappia albiluteola]
MRKVAITGWPVSHSRSPMIHGYWLKSLGVEGVYDRQAVAPEDADLFYRDFASSGLVGCNVTVPHKETALRACETLDDAARAIGAVNTLWLDGAGRLHGANTDAAGFLGSLDQSAPGWDEKPGAAVVLGAGGAARAIVWGLLQRGFKPVHIVNRTFEKAEKLASYFGSDSIAQKWEDLGDLLGKADILVNTTSLGMEGQPALDIDLSPLPDTAVVMDAVYVPLETGLLKQARARGNRTVDGLGMLLHQAVPGFEKWFGVRPDVTPELRALVVADLEKKS